MPSPYRIEVDINRQNFCDELQKPGITIMSRLEAGGPEDHERHGPACAKPKRLRFGGGWVARSRQ